MLFIFNFFIGGEYINKRILLISIFLIFFICVQSVVAVSDTDYTSNHTKGYLNDASLTDADDFSYDHLSNDLSSTGSGSKLFSSEYGSDLPLSESYIVSENISSENSSLSDSNDSNSLTTPNENGSTGNDSNLDSTNATDIVQIPQLIIVPENSSITSAYIQKIIDDAVPGSTIKFAGSFYKNLNLKVAKPLNIISESGTVINMTFNLPVFAILKGGSGTNISGFTANIADSFVEASDVSNMGIFKNTIFTKRTAIVLENVFDSKIENNQFLRFKTAIDISKSGGIVVSKNNITPDSSYNTGIKLSGITSNKKISILDNRIIGFDSRRESTGIHCGADIRNLLIQGNVIDNWYTAINFTNSITNVSILNNTLRYNGDGVVINGWITNFTFKKNVVTNTGRIGVHFDDDFRGTRGSFVLEKNFFTKSGHLDMKNTGADELNIGENFAKFLCNRIKMKYGYGIKTRQNGNAYYFSIVDRNGRGVKDLPSFYATINIGGTNYDVLFIDSVAYFESEQSGLGNDAVLDVGEDKRKLSDWGETQTVSSLDYYKKFYQDLINSLIENQTSSDSSDYNGKKQEDHRLSENNGTGTANRGNGGGDSGISDGRSSVSSNSNSAGSSGSSSVSPSSAAPASSPASPESATVKSLSIDDETFRVAGVGGLLFLIICVIGLYYREDILDMIKE